MVVPFVALILFVISVIIHTPFAFRRRRFNDAQGSVSRALDAAFFVPFAAFSTVLLAKAMRWDSSLHCFAVTAVLALPWLVTPWLATRLLAWSQR